MMFPSGNQRLGCLITLGKTSTSRSLSMSADKDGEGGEKPMRGMGIFKGSGHCNKCLGGLRVHKGAFPLWRWYK